MNESFEENSRTKTHSLSEIHDLEEHLSCYGHDNDNKPLIETLAKGAGDYDEISLVTNTIVIVVDGEIRFTVNDMQPVQLGIGQLVFMPSGGVLHYKALRQSMMLIMRLGGTFHLCQSFDLERLLGHITALDSEARKTLHALKANDSVCHLVKGLIENYDNGLRCRGYFRNEISNLLILLRNYYSGDELGRFFSSILSADVLFSEYVRTNWMHHRSVGSLAGAMSMTSQQFTRKFHRVFGQAPYEWMQYEKAQMVYAEICGTDKPLKEIVAQYGFPARANFNRFCKRSFGMNPGDIRKRKHGIID